MPLYPVVLTSTLITIMLILSYPLLTTLSPNSLGHGWALSHVKTAVKVAFFVSLLPLLIFLASGEETITSTWTWMNMTTYDLKISLKFDLYSIIFIPVALYVTWSILEFSSWYMESDPYMPTFYKYLLIFLISMIVLVTANNMFQLFVGWEGVGAMSFLLIGWWYARADANTAATQAILYNRIGDIGLFFVTVWIITNVGSWELDHIIPATKYFDLTYPLIGVVLAAAGKSAQFGLHPWLPSAMEGPTPVSALLHSSTMVVAGIFLMIRFSPLLERNQTMLTVCLCLGALSTLFAATCALTQNDIKKIVAYSTSSQLGLMMVAIGLNQPELAFLHMCTHAFFKAMLFLCAGSIIHSLNDEQDIRKMGGMLHLTPFTSSSFTVGTLALTGTPFLAGFFSKDAIIESLSTSQLNAWALALTLLATSFTAVYSLRVIYFVAMGQPRFPSLSPINENSRPVINSLKRLAWGSIVTGLIITSALIPAKTPVMSMPPLVKLVALIVTIVGLIMGLQLARLANKQVKPHPKLISHHFSNMLGYFPIVIHRLPTKTILVLGEGIASRTIDLTWLEKIGPKVLAYLNRPLITWISNSQGGKVATYIIFFILILALATACTPS